MLVGAGLTFGIATSFARDDLKQFDIPAQSLSSALESFSSVSGYQLLVAEAVPATVRSEAVQGQFSAHDALSRLIGGTGFEATYTSARAAVLMRAAGVREREALQHRDQIAYETALQNDVTDTLCRDVVTRPGRYRAALDLWVAPSGRVAKVELLSSTGDEVRDRHILSALRIVTSAAPPTTLAQPTTLIVLPKSVTGREICSLQLGDQRADQR